MDVKIFFFILGACNFLTVSSRPPFTEPVCGYASCPRWSSDPETINIHLVPHTHDDVGWLKTYEQYLFGTRKEITLSSVRNILNSVVNELLKDPERKFIYVESAFFWKWWSEQPDSRKIQVENLVNSGQLEFIGGGWSMNDEASTHYSSIIDNMSFGHRFLFSLFGKCGIPRVAWQIDPFGHSREQASLFALMNFDGYFSGRIDFYDKIKRVANKSLEFIWSGSDDIGPRSNIFSGVLPECYAPPKGFCFDELCHDSPIVEDPTSVEYNADEKVALFVEHIKNYKKMYLTNHLIFTMGEDFNYENAATWYDNLDRLIGLMRKFSPQKINIFYSTPSCYLLALNQANLTWPVKTDDFFPYSSDSHSYWAGFYSSRPTIKYYERFSNSVFQSIKQLHAIAHLNQPDENEVVNNFFHAMGILQHHDAVTGTERQHVANDYSRILSEAMNSSLSLINRAFSQILPKETNAVAIYQHFCPLLNVSECQIVTEVASKKIAVTLYNPYARGYRYTIRLPWDGSDFLIKNSIGQPVNGLVVPSPPYLKSLPQRSANASFQLEFPVNLTNLGFVTYFVEKQHQQGLTADRFAGAEQMQGSEPLNAKGNGFIASFDAESGNILSLTLDDGRFVKINQKFQWYAGMIGNNSAAAFRSSGAYIFRPDGSAQDFPETPKAEIVKHTALFEVRQTVSDYIYQVIRVRPDSEFIEFEYKVGPIPISDYVGKEIITVFDTNITSSDIFYTDSNGRQMMKRIRNDSAPEPIAGNYYPINSRITIKEESKPADGLQLVILTDRSHGGSSLRDGSVEVMIHRRLLHDDAFGVDEALNETGIDGRGLVTVGKLFMNIANLTNSNLLHREHAQRIYMSPLITFALYENLEEYINDYKTSSSFLSSDFPDNIHLLSLEMLNSNEWLIRLEHFFQSVDDPTGHSKDERVDVRKIFPNKKVQAVRETTLTGLQDERSAIERRLRWHQNSSVDLKQDGDNFIDDFIITLKPMQIRTLIITFES
ncbi:lysosomal alpha-mannosidase-like isoform X2 [Brevipalpus obovatus]|uniref:lysosomal alpha-mannosidase-like isoform X2 n=1 Tax=Brevipalpus obovatus TaxID=246614 RepID=UPI003D9E9D42